MVFRIMWLFLLSGCAAHAAYGVDLPNLLFAVSLLWLSAGADLVRGLSNNEPNASIPSNEQDTEPVRTNGLGTPDDREIIELGKEAVVAPAGTIVFWNDAINIVTLDGTGRQPLGVVYRSAAAFDGTVLVRLNR